MANILTPISLWSNFDDTLEISSQKTGEIQLDGIIIENVIFDGRAVGSGGERIAIAASYAYSAQSPAPETVLILPDSKETINYDILEFFVKKGYSALMVDYRGEWEGCDFFTRYPEEISYANLKKCGRRKDFVDDSADKTSWYEWAGVGLYARKYIYERTGSESIAVVGIRDGGEIAWKLGVAGKFACIIPVCAAGWKAYNGISKYMSEDPVLDEERYRFIAGIDSQAYAPSVKCPVLMLCSTNDPRFDYDRAYDTFLRINPEFVKDSSISFSVKCDAGIGTKGINDMFLVLDKYLKNRQVFIPKSPVVTVESDKEDNLIAKVTFDNLGIVADCKTYLAEDCIDSASREWGECPEKSKSDTEYNFYLNIFEKTKTIFVLSKVEYINGFTVWSKMAVKKISGKFRNMQCKCRVLYTEKNGTDGFKVINGNSCGVGEIFLQDNENAPKIVSKRGVAGLTSSCGLATYRLGNQRFAANESSLLSVDLFCDKTSEVAMNITDNSTGEEYIYTVNIVGGVWQTVIAECNLFKTAAGVPLASFSGDYKFMVTCPAEYAINNFMWL